MDLINIKWGFVILHYGEKSLVDTVECVDSIKKNCSGKEHKIIIVENGSKDSSSEFLVNTYQNTNVELLLLNQNLGFARGNNAGCSYLIENYNPDFIIVLNNDTIILNNNDKNILKQIEEVYTECEFDILGPKIIDRNKQNSNPLRSVIKASSKDVNDEIKKLKAELRIIENPVSINYLVYFLKIKIKNNRKFMKALKKLINKKNENQSNFIQSTQVPLHGSALIFSKKYIDMFGHNIFYPNTFLFLEEDILFYRAQQHNLKMLYTDKITIFHKEDVSTDSIITSDIDKRRFLIKNKLDSLYVFADILSVPNNQMKEDI